MFYLFNYNLYGYTQEGNLEVRNPDSYQHPDSHSDGFGNNRLCAMRTITLIIIHCSAVRPEQQSSLGDIDRWHRARGWKSCGYHFVVRRDGTIETGRPVEQVGAHCRYHNKYSIGICYEGGLDVSGMPADTRTAEQKAALSFLVDCLKERFPRALVLGHHDLDPMKECPCFNVVKEYK